MLTYHATNLGAWAGIDWEEETTVDDLLVEVHPAYSRLYNNVHILFMKLDYSIHMHEINAVGCVRILRSRFEVDAVDM